MCQEILLEMNLHILCTQATFKCKIYLERPRYLEIPLEKPLLFLKEKNYYKQCAQFSDSNMYLNYYEDTF